MPERSSYVEGTPSWVDLATSDPEAAKGFYSSVLGWEFADIPTDRGIPYTMASKSSKAVAGVMQQPPQQAEQGMPPMWTTYISVDDLEATLARVTDAGGQVVMPAMPVMESGHMAVITDPSGAAVGLWQPKDHIGAEVVNEHGCLTWNELLTSDLGAASEFFGKVFNWETEVQQMPTGEYTVFNLNGEGVAGGMAPPMPGIPNYWGAYFQVDNVADAAAAVTASGGSLLTEVIDIGIGQFVAAQDPQGAAFSLIEPAPQE